MKYHSADRNKKQVLLSGDNFLNLSAGFDLYTILSLISYVKDRPGHDRRYAINCDKLKNQLGWKQSVTFNEGLRETMKWYLSNSDWIERIRSGEWVEKNYEGR